MTALSKYAPCMHMHCAASFSNFSLCSWKKELEGIRKDCTGLLRERFQLEQCVR